MHTLYYWASIVSGGANAFLLGIWWCIASARIAPSSRMSYVLRSCAGLIVAVAAAEGAKAAVLWPNHPTFPSGHEAFGASLAVSLGQDRRRWLAISIGACAVSGWGLILWRVHMPVDVAAGALLGALATMAAFAGYKRRSDSA
jgi:membrane-associated phospholipid phosphatase